MKLTNEEKALFYDIRYGSLADIQAHIDAGVNLNITNGAGESPVKATYRIFTSIKDEMKKLLVDNGSLPLDCPKHTFELVRDEDGIVSVELASRGLNGDSIDKPVFRVDVNNKDG